MHQILERIINYALDHQASDIHLGAGVKPAVRLDGKIIFMKDMPALEERDIEVIAHDLIPQKFEANFNTEIDCSVEYQDRAFFRIHIYRARQGVNIALRYVSKTILSLDSLDIFSDCRNTIKQLIRQPHGLLLVTGPTGSGKSTSVSAIVDYLNETSGQHILTLEAPVEFIHESKHSLVKQREIGEGGDAPSFQNALRAALREDPDVIIVGEVRDEESMRLVLAAAQTGRLVIAEMHTSSTAQTINRMLNLFPATEQGEIRSHFANALVAIIGQRLVPRIGGGRVLILEILLNTVAIRNQIKENKIQLISDSIKTSKELGMILFDDYVRRLVDAGMVNELVARPFLP